MAYEFFYFIDKKKSFIYISIESQSFVNISKVLATKNNINFKLGVVCLLINNLKHSN